jgi:toxin secretion/phage lysis holin
MEIVNLVKVQIVEAFVSILSWVAIKTPVAIAIGVFGFMFGVGSEGIMGSLLILVIMDFITAIISKYKIGEEIESRNALKTVTKIFVYSIFVSACHLASEMVSLGQFMDRVSISFLALTELISILENIGKMGYVVPKKLLGQLHKMRNDQ